ncbi:MAG TPA: terminase family protein [Bryobacteraceae bacterium]
MSPIEMGIRRYSFDPVGFARELLGWTPDPKQAEALGTCARRVILNCSRQWGKSTVAAIKMAHVAVTRPGRTILIVCENLAQAGELFQILDGCFGRLGIATKGVVGKKFGRTLMTNGSRIFAIAGREAGVRGYTADFVFLDEAARIPDEVIDAFAPVVAVRKGDWWMASTPCGKRGRFFEVWEYADPGTVVKIRAAASENPRIDPEFVEQARRERGEQYVKQEYECEFVENGTYLLSREQILAVCSAQARPRPRGRL